MDDPSMMPDLSHLSAEEREIIEQVFKRQRDEEAKETQMSQKASEELTELDKQINERKETSKKLIGTQDDAICQICQKTKFADGIGHKCFYCQLRSCARCGGRAQSKNKAIWACSLCQKRQQILAKTGKWFQPEEAPPPETASSTPAPQIGPGGQQQQQPKISISGATPTPMQQNPNMNQMPNQQQQQQFMQQQQQHPQQQQQQMQQHPNHQQQPTHQRQPQQQRQPEPPDKMQNYNQQQQPGQNMNMQNHRRQSMNQSQQMQQQQMQQQPQNFRNSGPMQQQQQQPNQRQPNQNQGQNRFQGPSNSTGNGPIFNQQQSQQNQQQQQQNLGANQQNQQQQQQQFQQMGNQQMDNNRRRDGNMYNKQASFDQSSSLNQNQNQNNQYNRMEDNGSMNHRPTFFTGNNAGGQDQYVDGQKQPIRKNTGNRVTEEDYASSASFESKKQRNHNSQAQPNNQGVRACPPENDHLNRVKNRLHRQLRSMSSSEEDIIVGGSGQGGTALKMSTSAVIAAGNKTSFHEDMGASNVQRLSEECNSEKDLLRYIYGDKNSGQSGSMNSIKNLHPRLRDKSLSVSPHRNPDPFGLASVMGGDPLASRIRNFLSHPVTWQPSADQKRLIGHMILHRIENGSNGDLGLKIVGGRRTDTGKLGAFITQVKPGSVGDTIGRLRPGDEVVEWNGQSLQNATYEQVYDSIAASRYDTHVELIVSRNALFAGSDDFLNMVHHQNTNTAARVGAAGFPQSFASQQHLPQHQRQLPNPELFIAREPQVAVPTPQNLSHSQSANFVGNTSLSARNRSTSTYHYSDVDLGVPPPTTFREILNPQAHGTGHIFGRIEVSFVYSHHDRQLSVALERAYDLPPRPDGTPRNPYVKIFLLPDRSEKSRRQSAVIAETLMPVWNEVFYYNGLTEPMIMQRVLEMTVWDYDKFGTNSFLGETLIDLGSVPLDGEHSLMCTLVDMDDDNPLRTRLKLRKASTHQHVRRPQSEMNYYEHTPYYNNIAVNGIEKDEENDDYIDDDDLENDIDLATGSVIRKSRVYDRHRRDKPHGYADWSINHQRSSGSGYMSDHGYGRQTMMSRTFNRKQRRPRSATALMHMGGRDEMFEQRKYSKHHERADEEDYLMPNNSQSQYYPNDNSMYDDPRYRVPPNIQQPPSAQPHSMPAYQNTNHHHPPPHHQPSTSSAGGQMQQQQQQPLPQQQQPQQQQLQQPPMMQQQGYYSDGSETMSVHSCNSMPMITTINRRNLAAASTADNASFDDNSRVPIKEAKQSSMASSSSMANSATASNSNSGNAGAMKERKKSLMTRFIPGRSAAGEGKRTGFARSEEVGIPGNLSSDRLVEPTPPFLKQASKESTDSAHSDNWLPILADGPLGTFVDNLGPGQVVGRQVLASPVLGEIQIGLMAGRSGIDVEIIRAKNLVVKPGVKICPAPYVKVYLMEGKQCVAKAKTNAATKTTCPLFQQHLIFNDNQKKKMLQITVLGDYGRMERKVFMGIAQIRLDDLELGPQPLIGWYKLFHSSSLAGTGPVRKDSDVSVGGAQQ